MIEMIEDKIAKLNFEQKELKESVDENWEKKTKIDKSKKRMMKK